jgi:hypothetical protein
MEEITEIEQNPQQILHGFEKADPGGVKAARPH